MRALLNLRASFCFYFQSSGFTFAVFSSTNTMEKVTHVAHNLLFIFHRISAVAGGKGMGVLTHPNKNRFFYISLLK